MGISAIILLVVCGYGLRSSLSLASDRPDASPKEKTAKKTVSVRVPLALELEEGAVEKRLMSDVEYLASEELEGRGVRTRGLELAGEHIAKAFTDSGLTADHYGGPFHHFRLFSASRRGSVQTAELVKSQETSSEKLSSSDSSDTKTTLVKGTDFTSLAAGPQGRFVLPIVFAGYGITAEKINYDDYANLDVRGKAVIVLRHEPQRNDADSPFDGTENSPHAFVRSKIKNAMEHGAAALILCTGTAELQHVSDESGDTDESSSDPPAPGAESLLQAELGRADVTDNIPVIHIRRAVIEKLIRETLSEELTAIEKRIDQTLKPESKTIPNITLSGETQIIRSSRRLRNVVASLEGSGENAEETIIVGAHYDHLGKDGWGSLSLNGQGEVHYGADDNASGTAVLMEVARQLASLPKPLGRRVLFIAFSAEELGLIGSKQYVQDPLFPLNQTVAMVNLDMVGRLREGKLTAFGMETAQEWSQLVVAARDKISSKDELKLILRPGGYGPSDHASFYEKGVPVLHFFTGFHPQYHRPSDVANLINGEGLRQIAALTTEIVVELANREARLTPRSSGSSDDSIASLLGEMADPVPSPDSPRLGVQVAPDSGGEGVVIRRLVSKGLADQNGMRVGDVITSVNDKPVRSAAEIVEVLQKPDSPKEWTVRFKRGDVVAEVVVRQSL